jgi:hypothetical protein
LGAFVFRSLFGLFCPPIIVGEDETQIYTIGLKSYTTQTWPTFGPDVVSPDTPFTTQIPGALQGLLVAFPLRMMPVPEAPFLFLNLLSLLSLSFLGWYVCRRLPNLSPYFVFSWLFIAPWTTHYTTQVLNPSYAAIGAILFFVGFLETFRDTPSPILRSGLADALMGFGFFWVFQLHMSWVLLGPFIVVTSFLRWRQNALMRSCGAFLLGALPMLALLLPTYLQYGFTSGKDVQGFATALNLQHLFALPEVAGKFLSFASFEMPRFIGQSSQARFDYLLKNGFLLVPAVFLWVIGIAQPIALLILGFKGRSQMEDWKTVRRVTLGCVLLIWITFWFSVKSVGSNSFYITFPLAFVFSFYCYGFLADSRRWRRFAKIFMVMAIAFQVGYAYVGYMTDASVYLRTRELMKKAIQSGDYRALSERRTHSLY